MLYKPYLDPSIYSSFICNLDLIRCPVLLLATPIKPFVEGRKDAKYVRDVLYSQNKLKVWWEIKSVQAQGSSPHQQHY